MRRAMWLPALGACVLFDAQLLMAQPPEIPPLGTIDFYGLETIAKSEVRELLPIQEGFDFTGDLPSSDTVTAEMAEALGVSRVVFNVICCTDDGLSQLYVGVDESAQATSQYYAAPAGDVRLPPDVVDNFDEFLDRMMAGVIQGNASEDHSQGHALASADDVRRTQEIFIEQAYQQLELMIDVLEHSSDARHRSIAAHVLGYARDKSAVAPILATAVLDPDEGVRNYSTRSLAVIAEFANANPDLGIVIRSEPFIAMLNSVVWSDRNKSLGVLANLTKGRDADLLERLRTRALVSLMEMCEWHHWGHASPACLILQRIAGLPDNAEESSRESTLSRAMALIDQRSPR